MKRKVYTYMKDGEIKLERRREKGDKTRKEEGDKTRKEKGDKTRKEEGVGR